jgi:hypothetical protein
MSSFDAATSAAGVGWRGTCRDEALADAPPVELPLRDFCPDERAGAAAALATDA